VTTLESHQPAPPCDIHPDDRGLAGPADIDWWKGLSVSDVQALDVEDQMFRYSAFVKFVERDGLSDQEAGRRIRQMSQAYYMALEDRADEQLAWGQDDLKLPYMIKERVNRAVVAGVITRDVVRTASSFNAVVRRLIAKGQI